MNVSVQNSENISVWEFGMVNNGQTFGVTSTKYRIDGTLQKVIDALKLALIQAEGELSLLDNIVQ